MAGWVAWLIAACALALGAGLTDRRGLRQWVAGAALAALVMLAGTGVAVSVVAFVLGSLLAGTVLRRRARAKARRSAARYVTPERLTGKQGVVLEEIANRDGIGCIELEGEIWTARAYERDRVIDAGTEVTVVAVRGATAVVSE